MAGKKWKKHIAADPRSFRRPRGSKRPGTSILIVTEGQVTEPVYFHALKQKLHLSTVEIEVVGAGKGDPRRLAESAIEGRKKRKKAARDGSLSFSKATDFDKLWIVFDTDVPVEHSRFHDGVAFAKSNGVETAHSTPCFEYWLLLHLDYTTAPMAKFVDVKPRLEKALERDYAKDCKESAKLIPPLLNNLDDAVSRAQQVREHHDTAGTPAPANPSTEMDRLIECIRTAASPAN
ncbi:MAG: RloB family protein [Verrucomicrobiota bacterium]